MEANHNFERYELKIYHLKKYNLDYQISQHNHDEIIYKETHRTGGSQDVLSSPSPSEIGRGFFFCLGMLAAVAACLDLAALSLVSKSFNFLTDCW